jgi:cell division protein FtsI/penicillin-binding protein 2
LHDDSRIRFRKSGSFLALLFVCAALSQAKLQVLERSSTLDLAKESKRFTLKKVDKARRGAILAADGKPLAQDADTCKLTVNFRKVPVSEAFFLDLSAASGIPSSEFASLAESGTKSKTWLDPIPADQTAAIKEVKKKWRADGVSLDADDTREYPLGESAACLVGVIREMLMPVADQPGKLANTVVPTGLEKSKNQILSGTDGVRVGLTDRKGAFLPMRMEEDSQPRVDGKNITLTIDSDLQDYAAKAIKDAVVEHKAENGSAIVVDPHTGDILAMANYPSFDPNGHIEGEFGYNPVYMAQLEPGSTFKILTLAKALDAGVVDMNTIVNCHGSMQPTGKGRPIKCDAHHGNRAHGPTDPLKAIAKSCNVCAATWALRITRPSMIDYIEKLGLLKKTGMFGPTEAHGLFRYDEYAQQLQLATVGFGQSITCTPVGLIGAFSMLANDGVRVPPRLIKKIGDEELPVGKGERIIGKDAADKVISCMEAVIESDAGTGKDLRIPGYRLGGKTGTAEKVGSKRKGYVSNFIGFVPAERPRAVILVMVNDPKNGYYGAAVAGPAFKDIAKAVIRHFNIPPSVTSQAGQ